MKKERVKDKISLYQDVLYWSKFIIDNKQVYFIGNFRYKEIHRWKRGRKKPFFFFFWFCYFYTRLSSVYTFYVSIKMPLANLWKRKKITSPYFKHQAWFGVYTRTRHNWKIFLSLLFLFLMRWTQKKKYFHKLNIEILTFNYPFKFRTSRITFRRSSFCQLMRLKSFSFKRKRQIFYIVRIRF